MKPIMSSNIPGEIALLKDMLERAGIACFIRNENSAGLSPDIPLNESTPELWIQDDQRLTEAQEIKRLWKTSVPPAGGNWVCPKCGETSEPQFTSCWKCGTARKEDEVLPWSLNTNPQSSEPITPPQEKEPTAEEAEGKVPCVACGKLLDPQFKYCPHCGYTQPYEPAA